MATTVIVTRTYTQIAASWLDRDVYPVTESYHTVYDDRTATRTCARWQQGARDANTGDTYHIEVWDWAGSRTPSEHYPHVAAADAARASRDRSLAVR